MKIHLYSFFVLFFKQNTGKLKNNSTKMIYENQVI